MKSLVKVLMALALGAVILMPGMASAYPLVNLYEVRVDNNTTTTILAPTYSPNQVSVYTGNYIVSLSNPAGSGNPYVQYSGYCVEPVDSVTSSPGLVYELLPIAALPSAEIPAFTAAAWIRNQGYNGTPQSAVAQVAVWELTWDTALGKPFDLHADNFQLISGVSETDVTNLYNLAIAAAATFDPSGYVIAHNPAGSTGFVYAQDYIIPTPLPPSAILLGSGLLGLLGLGWRRRKTDA